MREAVFLRLNEKKWLQIENQIQNGFDFTTEQLVHTFTDLTADLSYARSNYPSSKTVDYLNQLSGQVYKGLYRKDERWKSNIAKFWKYDLPLQFYLARKELLLSFLIFFGSVVIGVISTHYDSEFPNIVLSEEYVNRTIENIEKGDPTAVYKNGESAYDFMWITINNIKVSLFTFISGLFFGIGSYTNLFKNGVMVGAFQHFFYTRGVFLTSFLSIWIHGTIEISSIIMAGAAGIVMGNSFLFPGTRTRKESLKIGARRGSKMVLGLIPLFILAGFLESFVTRHSEWHAGTKAGIIISSFLFILYYFVLYPHRMFHQTQIAEDEK